MSTDDTTTAGVHNMNSAPRRQRQGRSTKQLACTNCRRKKVKCHPGPGAGSACDLCHRLQEVCWTPQFDERRRLHTKQLIEQLRAENTQLRAELEDHRQFCLVDHHSGSSGMSDRSSETSESAEAPTTSAASSSAAAAPALTLRRSDNMIMRLCGGQRQLNSDRVGRLRFFGPTSSLHLMESVTSSLLVRGGGRIGGDGLGSDGGLPDQPGTDSGSVGNSTGIAMPIWQTDFPPQVQEHLLDLYWTYQHQVLPCIHKEAFLRDMRNGDTKYCSSLLVLCILTRAAAISSEPGLRALALADDAEDDPPYLVRKCTVMLEQELDTPGITTAQALQLLSEMHCAISHDTKGWMYAGGAGRLAYELGLHRDPDDFGTTAATEMTQLDKEVRQVVFWSCFNLDRAWALYLGRPQSIRLEDVDAKRPGEGGSADVVPPGEVRVAAAWCSLLEIVGKICEILNGVHTPRLRMENLVQSLEHWRATLHPSLQFETGQTPAMIIMRMQYAAAMILLHRPLAQFGKDLTALGAPDAASSAEQSRQICIDHAGRIAGYLQEYAECHGSVMTMSWVSLHIVATAATTLIANIAERRPGADPTALASQLDSLRRCLGTLSELEKSHVVTRRVRKVIQSAIRLLNIDAVIQTGGGSSSVGGGMMMMSASTGATGMMADWMTPFGSSCGGGGGGGGNHAGYATGTGLGNTVLADSTPSSSFLFANMPPTPGMSTNSSNTAQQFPLFNLLPSSNAPFEFLNSFESYFS
ncbi:hypothetical protein SBRCBS47491_009655 [Sporothrix bragantina]|uniref:Zn(2)-C6 fungal-type domain-containing protein n=1 Tax=Sporothrix bragantina TaxID=671064 RepID=A0ABP0CZ81_9PEZI